MLDRTLSAWLRPGLERAARGLRAVGIGHADHLTWLGFALGMALGVLIAIGVVHSRVLDRGLLPWIIASQTIPILAIAPMVVVVLGSLGYPPLVSKAVISMYLCFFPVAIGMVKGLRSPEVLQLDLMRTWSASQTQRLLKLRLPAAVPFLFASAKIAIATSLIGAIVGELPTGAQAGLGARLLSGSYFGQTIQIWSALLMASLLGKPLVLVNADASLLLSTRSLLPVADAVAFGFDGPAASSTRREASARTFSKSSRNT